MQELSVPIGDQAYAFEFCLPPLPMHVFQWLQTFLIMPVCGFGYVRVLTLAVTAGLIFGLILVLVTGVWLLVQLLVSSVLSPDVKTQA